MELIMAIIIFIAPVILAILFTRRYNMILGLLAFVLGAYILMFLAYNFDGADGAPLVGQVATYLTVGEVNLLAPYQIIFDFINGYTFNLIPGIKDDAGVLVSWAKYVYIGGFFVVFLIVWIISGKIASKKREKIKKLKRLANRQLY